MTTDRTEPRWWAKGSPRCRSCGKPHGGFLVCEAEGCQRWLVECTARLIADSHTVARETREDALQATISLPKQSGSRIGIERLTSAKRKAIARTFEAQAEANQRRQIHREHVSRWRGEDIVVAKEVYL